MKLTRRALLGKLPFGIAGVWAVLKGVRQPEEQRSVDDLFTYVDDAHGRDEPLTFAKMEEAFRKFGLPHGVMTYDEMYPIGTIVDRATLLTFVYDVERAARENWNYRWVILDGSDPILYQRIS